MDIPDGRRPPVTAPRVALISFHTCPLAPPGSGKAGGMNVYVRNLARHLACRGVSVDVFTRTHPAPEPCDALTAGTRLVHLEGGPPEVGVWELPEHLPHFLAELESFRKSSGSTYSVVHAHYWLSGWVGLRVTQEWDVPLVVIFHTLARTKEQAMGPGGDPTIRSAVEKEVASAANLIVAFTPHEKAALVELYGASPEKVEVVPAGVDLALFRPVERRKARQALGLGDEKVLLWVGRIEAIKGVELLLHTAAIIQSRFALKVFIVGEEAQGQGELEELKGLARRLGLGEQAIFVGRVQQEQLPFYYSAADVSVIPSYYESFGLAALEAMACGIPVVATRVGGLPYLVRHGSTGYLADERSPEAFAALVGRLLEDESLRLQMGREALQHAQSFGWPGIVGRIEALYDRLCTQRRRGAVEARCE